MVKHYVTERAVHATLSQPLVIDTEKKKYEFRGNLFSFFYEQDKLFPELKVSSLIFIAGVL